MNAGVATAQIQHAPLAEALDAVQRARSSDDAFRELNSRYRGFAGIHIEGGRAIVSATSVTSPEELGDLVVLAGGLSIDVGEVTTRVVQFEFTELSSLRDLVTPTLAFGGGAHAIDVDERSNRVAIYVRDEQDRLLVGPVFIRNSLLTNEISVMGVEWGSFNNSSFIFSHWTNVQSELGTLNYLP